MKKIVKEFGFDANENEVDMLFKLTDKNSENGLNIQSFIDLMTKDNVYFNTINIERKHFQDEAFFSPKIHEVLRNKFYKLK